MKNTQKGFSTIAVVAVLVIGVGVVYLLSQKSSQRENDLLTPPSISTGDTVTTPAENVTQQYTDPSGVFSFSYSKNAFKVLPVSEPLDPEYGTEKGYPGVKLIFTMDENKIGTRGVGEGSGLPYTVTLNALQGLSFVVVNDSVANLTNMMKADLRNVVIAGKNAMSWSRGRYGSGITHYIIPVSSNKTLIIVHHYQNKQVFTDAVVNNIFKTLVIN